MSQGKDHHEAERWLRTATSDLGAARTLAAGGYHAQACFSAQQAAEKAAKAIWYLTGSDPWGHSIQALINDFPWKDRLDDVDALIKKAAVLDRYYIPTRYPNGLPDLTPDMTYFTTDSEQAIGLAEDFLKILGQWMETWR
jgi:HEPN domain-containing protein